jgi:phenylalanyl-tRNA synthetase beta chain
MLVSYKLLQSYFDKKIPSPEKLRDLFTFHSFEVEGLRKASSVDNSDMILDVKILPDRACYCLCHMGIARELSAITDIPIKEHQYKNLQISNAKEGMKDLQVTIEENNLCNRYVGRRIDNISIEESPKWLKEYLEVLEAKSINSVVDVANFIMQDTGQPLHVFDADKVEGKIIVRLARAGEKITTLDNKEIILNEKILIIADDQAPLAIAGIKGGKKAEVTKNTKNIIIESAHFNASYIRKASQIVGIKTDASKRFENNLSAELAGEAMIKVTELIESVSADKSGLKIGKIVDVYPLKETERKIEISLEKIENTLGVKIDEKEILSILERLDIVVGKNAEAPIPTMILTIPFWRNDLIIPEDIVEEMGRIYGYDKIPEVLSLGTEDDTEKKTRVDKKFYYENKIREILVAEGFSEVMTSYFASKGEVEIINPLALDKKYLRPNLHDGMSESLLFNAHYAEFLGLDQIKIFEIGNVFTEKFGENTRLAMGIKQIGKVKKGESFVKELMIQSYKKIEDQLGLVSQMEHSIGSSADTSVEEMALDFSSLPNPDNGDTKSQGGGGQSVKEVRYKPISPYPFILRDIAVFVPQNISDKEVLDLIKREAGKDEDSLLVKERLFDTFEKGEKVSYAFRLVFQSYEKTLSDDVVNVIMEKITKTLNSQKDWQVR